MVALNVAACTLASEASVSGSAAARVGSALRTTTAVADAGADAYRAFLAGGTRFTLSITVGAAALLADGSPPAGSGSITAEGLRLVPFGAAGAAADT